MNELKPNQTKEQTKKQANKQSANKQTNKTPRNLSVALKVLFISTVLDVLFTIKNV